MAGVDRSRTDSSNMNCNSQQGPQQEPKIIPSLMDIKLPDAEKVKEPGRKQEKVRQPGRKQEKVRQPGRKQEKVRESGRKQEKVDVDQEEAEEEKTQEIYRVVKSILDNLSPQKFKMMKELSIDSEIRLKGVTDLIFEKAVSEPSFSATYASLCRHLMQFKVPSVKKPGEMVTFRGVLLTKCQREFEKIDVESDKLARQEKINNAQSEEVKKQLLEEKDVAETQARRRSIGNIKFMGELFKLEMLTAKTMHDCVFKLLKFQNEENLECLCQLLTTIGKNLDEPKAKARIDQYIEKMLKIVKQKRVSPRVLFMLQYVADLRLCKWVPQREDDNSKTIDQIYEETAEEAAKDCAQKV